MNELDFKGGEGWCGGGTKNGKGREDKRRVCCQGGGGLMMIFG